MAGLKRSQKTHKSVEPLQVRVHTMDSEKVKDNSNSFSSKRKMTGVSNESVEGFPHSSPSNGGAHNNVYIENCLSKLTQMLDFVKDKEQQLID